MSAIDELLARVRSELGHRVGPREAAAVQEAGGLLVDIRYAELRERDGIIPGALIVERNELAARPDGRTPRSGSDTSRPAGRGRLQRRLCIEPRGALVARVGPAPGNRSGGRLPGLADGGVAGGVRWGGWGGVEWLGWGRLRLSSPPPLPSPTHPELHSRPSASSCTTVIVAARHSAQSPRTTGRSHRPAVAARPAPGCPSGPGAQPVPWDARPTRFVTPGPVAPHLPRFVTPGPVAPRPAPVCHARPSDASPRPGSSHLVQ